jgi:hypothetical protein
LSIELHAAVQDLFALKIISPGFLSWAWCVLFSFLLVILLSLFHTKPAAQECNNDAKYEAGVYTI